MTIIGHKCKDCKRSWLYWNVGFSNKQNVWQSFKFIFFLIDLIYELIYEYEFEIKNRTYVCMLIPIFHVPEYILLYTKQMHNRLRV